MPATIATVTPRADTRPALARQAWSGPYGKRERMRKGMLHHAHKG